HLRLWLPRKLVELCADNQSTTRRTERLELRPLRARALDLGSVVEHDARARAERPIPFSEAQSLCLAEDDCPRDRSGLVDPDGASAAQRSESALDAITQCAAQEP